MDVLGYYKKKKENNNSEWIRKEKNRSINQINELKDQ